MAARPDATIDGVGVSAYVVPTDFPESDGTLAWDATTLVLVEVAGGGCEGLGFTYADTATATLVKTTLADVVTGRDALDVPAAWQAMVHSIRNLGRPGIASMAIAAVDVALWDLKAKLLDLPLVRLLGAARERLPVYGSGGFTSYPVSRLKAQLSDWVAEGIPRVKMKVGRHPERDLGRVQAAREAIGPAAELYVDANGAWNAQQARAQAESFRSEGVSWLEEPVSSDDLRGLRFVRDHAPAGMEVAAGEYGYDLPYFARMLDAAAVDVLQADASRCAGISGFLSVAALCDGHGIPLSSHCAPSLHLHPGCAVARMRHAEYFHDHVRIERMFFDGVGHPSHGMLAPDPSRPGLGLELKRADAARFAA